MPSLFRDYTILLCMYMCKCMYISALWDGCVFMCVHLGVHVCTSVCVFCFSFISSSVGENEGVYIS